MFPMFDVANRRESEATGGVGAVLPGARINVS
jgi:hypothetical protein